MQLQRLKRFHYAVAEVQRFHDAVVEVTEVSLCSSRGYRGFMMQLQRLQRFHYALSEVTEV